MKRIRIVLIALSALLMVGILGSCGGEKDPELIIAAATGFLEGVKNADPEEIRKYSLDSVMNDEDLVVFDAAAVEESIYQSLGIGKEILDPAVQEQISGLCERMSGSFLKDYKLGEPQIGEDGTAQIEADVTFGYEVDAVLSGQEMNEKLDEFIGTYQEQNKEALFDLYTKEGEEAMYRKVYNDLMPQIISALTAEMENSSPAAQKMKLTLQKKDGEWKVTDAWNE